MYKILELSSVYDNIQKLLGYERYQSKIYNNYIKENLKSSSKVLDLGCGTSSIVKHFNEINFYLGIDNNKDYLSKAENNLREKKITSLLLNLDLERHQIDKVVSERGFNLILLFGVMHHIPDNELLSLLENIKKLAGNECRLITADPAIYKAQNYIPKIIAKLDRGRYVRSPDEYRNILKKATNIVKDDLILSDMLIPSEAFVSVCQI
jgi:SAM-dependent methyltransferase